MELIPDLPGTQVSPSVAMQDSKQQSEETIISEGPIEHTPYGIPVASAVPFGADENTSSNELAYDMGLVKHVAPMSNSRLNIPSSLNDTVEIVTSKILGPEEEKRDSAGKPVPPGSIWTRIDGKLVDSKALEHAGLEFEWNEGSVIAFKVLDGTEVQELADHTKSIREERGKSRFELHGSISKVSNRRRVCTRIRRD